MLLLLLIQRIRKLAFGQPHSASARTYTSGKVVERYALHRGKFYATVASRPQCKCEMLNVGLRIRVEPQRVRQDVHLKKGTSSVKTLNVGLRIRVKTATRSTRRPPQNGDFLSQNAQRWLLHSCKADTRSTRPPPQDGDFLSQN